jgi:hypothetical protein
VLVFRKTDIVGRLTSDVGLASGKLSCENFSQVRPFDDLKRQTLGISKINQELIGSHLDDVFLTRPMSTCFSYVFSEIRMKVPELLP